MINFSDMTKSDQSEQPATLPYCVYIEMCNSGLYPATYGDCQFRDEFIGEFVPKCLIAKTDEYGKIITRPANKQDCKFHENNSEFIRNRDSFIFQNC